MRMRTQDQERAYRLTDYAFLIIIAVPYVNVVASIARVGLLPFLRPILWLRAEAAIQIMYSKVKHKYLYGECKQNRTPIKEENE